jgi:hypothetical protein
MYLENREPPCKSEALPQVNRLCSGKRLKPADLPELAPAQLSMLGRAANSCHKQPMTVSLRAHHLLCLLTYLGKGYTPAFVANYSRIVRRLNNGETVRLVSGPDDLCRPMLTEPNCHCHNESVRLRDDQAAADVSKVLGVNLDNADDLLLDADRVRRLREAFATGLVRTACNGCEWHQLCTGIAQNNFRGCRLTPPG